jgi:hypothetical protein
MFLDIGEEGRAEKVYQEHLEYCEPVKKQRQRKKRRNSELPLENVRKKPF